MRLTTWSFVLTLGGVLGPSPRVPAVAGEAPEGLRLEASTETTTAEANTNVPIAVRLVNGSRTATHAVVRSNDGSPFRWREPYVYWTATRIAPDGSESPLERLGGKSECGFYAIDWMADVIQLGPGESMAVEWMTEIYFNFDLSEPGVVRFVAHYAWLGGLPRGWGVGEPYPDLGLMKGIPPYELASNPVEIRVVQPIEVVAEAKASARVGREMRLSDLVAVRLTNRSNEKRMLWMSDPIPSLSVEYQAPPGAPDPEVAPLVGGSRRLADRHIAPGATVILLAPGQPASSPDFTVTFAAPGVYRIATWSYFVHKPNVRSNWVEITVVGP